MTGNSPAKPGNGNGNTKIQRRNQQRILAAALEIFSRYGYRGATVAQIAEAAEMSKPNLLYYFKSKNAIYLAVLENTLTEWLTPLTRLNPDGDPFNEIWRYVQCKLESSRNAPEASRLFANEVLQGAPMIHQFLANELKTLVDEKCAVIQSWVDSGKIAPITPIHLIFLIWASTQHYADFHVQISALDKDTDTLFSDGESTLKTIILGGLRPTGAD